MPETKTLANVRSPLQPERARQLLLAEESEEVLARSVRLAAVALRAPVATLGVPVGDRLRLVAQVGVQEPWLRTRALPLTSAPCRHAFPLDRPLAIESLEREQLTRDHRLEGYPQGAYLGMALRVGGQPVAVLAVLHWQARRWSEEEITLLRDLCSVVQRDLELLAPRVEDHKRDLELLKLQAREQQLRDREAQWRSLLEQSGSGAFATARDGQFTDFNTVLLGQLGLTAGETQALRLQDVCMHPGEWTACERELETSGATGPRELELLRRDGSTLHVTLSASVRRADTGEILGYQGVIRDITEQRLAEQKLLESALHDPLTRLPNRTLLLDRLERLLRHSKRRAGYRFALLFIDLDDFKAVNDTHGHPVGDRLLTEVGSRLTACVRQEDTVARIGGDEFAVLLDAIGDATGVIQAAERFLHELGLAYDEVGHPGIGASIGIALSMTGYETVDDMLRDADTAMYRAKSAGGRQFVVFDTDMYRRMRAQLELETELKQALQRNQLALHYHPVIALEGGKVAGMEALLRWSHPDRGVLLPDEFIPLAERTGLIVEIGWWVLREACRQLRAWQYEYPESTIRLTMSVNLSSRQFLQPELVQKLDGILEETGLDPHALRLDITEASVAQNTTLAARLLAQLGERGIQICIDDFGTGYSSLNELRNLPISSVKIAPRFVRELQLEDRSSKAVVQTIIALGRSMAIDAIAEGVETPEQLQQLRSLGTRFAQGFLFSLPLDSERARELISR